MDRMLYLAMSAARQTMHGQALATNNLANASTTGFKGDFQAARAMPVSGSGHAARVYAMAERPGTNLAPGTIRQTGNDTDIAINGPGYIAVMAPDGTEAYTRAGDLRVTVNGLLETGAGHPVLGNGGPVAVPQSQSMLIGVDGTISVRPLGQEANTLAQVDRIKLVNPEPRDLRKGDDGLLRLADGSNAPADAAVRVTSGALEGSNVNPVSEMITVIEHARRYEMAVKAMATAQRMDQSGGRLLHLNN